MTEQGGMHPPFSFWNVFVIKVRKYSIIEKATLGGFFKTYA